MAVGANAGAFPGEAIVVPVIDQVAALYFFVVFIIQAFGHGGEGAFG